MKIVFTGGGTGGHILPIIAIARELRRSYQGKDLKLFYIGPRDAFGDILLSQEEMKAFVIQAGKLRRYLDGGTVFQNVIDLVFRVPLGIFQAFRILFFLSPDLIFSKGGYGAIPATIAGWFLRIPIFLHESDAIPGLANRISGKFALEIFTSFPSVPYFSSKKIIFVGNPIRRELLTGSKQEATQLFQLTNEKPILLILGGSQGAQRINDVMLAVLNEALGYFEIIHQTGEQNFQQVRAEANVVIKEEYKKCYHPIPFLNEAELRHVYAASDIIVSRAGSGSIFEIAALGKPSILIPLGESAQNHQLKNAYAYAGIKAAIVLEQANLTPHFFLERLRSIAFSPEISEQMSSAALKFAKPQAARIIAQYILEYLIK
ncbi:MAG: UDP-N-acetylglucosamine--N-acetylmuramyl-(pentapeptide) pyrophosphoryl-undecaprenol N-acetylglucosamine transferase [Patescibacteria group bacterium]